MQDRDSLLTRVEIETAIIAIRKDGIIHAYFKAGTVLDVKLQYRALEIYLFLAGDKKRGVIYEAGPNCRLTKEARENAFNLEDKAPFYASAVLVKNGYQKVIAEFYYKVRKPKDPYGVFWKFDKAIEFLKSFPEYQG